MSLVVKDGKNNLSPFDGHWGGGGGGKELFEKNNSTFFFFPFLL